ncbi:MAG TPA: GDP-mannose 4,6-dehydratase [Anaerolineales bacterium]|nr:GDP-mannose 4,6-dehydratase [Anaerolineales bacterium]
MKNLLVTGGAGFIGSNFVHHMLGKYADYRIVVFDKLTYAGRLENLKPAEGNPRFDFVRGDICDADAVESAVRQFDIDTIVNFAAESVVANTLIPVHYGHGIKLVTIEDLFATYAKKRGVTTNRNSVEIVEPKLPLFALSFCNGMGQWRRITHITRHRYTNKVVTLRQKWGSITVTPNHSVYNADAQLIKAKTNPELLAIRKINVDRSRHRDYLKIHLPAVKSVGGLLFAPTARGGGRPREVYVRQTLKGKALLALMRFLGAYVAEGNALFNKANGSWQVCIANCDLEFLKQIQTDAGLFTNALSSITLRKKPGAHQLVFSSHIIYLLVTTLCGERAHAKQVPDPLYTLLDKHKFAFLDDYLRGDGNIQQYKSVETRRLTTTSPKLASGIGLLLSLMGLDYCLSYRDFERHETWSPAYSIAIVSNYDSRVECKYSESEYDDFVYDLTVEGSHNFAAGIGNIVVHNTHVDRSILASDAVVKTNVNGTHVLLEAAREFKLERFHQISTDEVYGQVPAPNRSREGDPLEPRSPYSASKAGAEHLVYAYFVTYDLPVTTTRGSNNIGPYHYPEKAVPLFTTNAIDNQPLPIYGDGMQQRDYQYVLDHCEAIDLILRKGQLGEIYNVGTGVETHNIDMARKILDILGKPHSLITHVTDRAGHDRRYALDINKLRGLGWKPSHNFDQALELTVRWFVENEWWWRPIKTGEYMEYYRKQYVERQA